MNLDEQRQRYRALDDWFKTPQGQYLGEAFLVQLSQFKAHLNPNVLLQLGLCGDNPWLSMLHFKQTWLCTPCLDASNATFIASPQHLPLQQNTVDVVIVPLMLEVFGWHKSPLDEVDRVLSPMGHVIFLGVNPMSLWGLALACRGLSALGQARMRPHAPLMLKHAFLNRGYQQRRFETFYDVPPFKREQCIKRSSFLNEVGKIMPIFPSGFYCIVMQKYNHCPLKIKTQTEPLLTAPIH